MNAHEMLSEDGQAVLLLCSVLGLSEEQQQGAPPLTLSQWNQLARKIHASPFQRPAALIGRNASELASTLQISPEEAQRIARLAERGGRLALELENLYGRGMWALTRVDSHYPVKLRETLKHQAPAVIFGAGEIQLLARGGIAVVGSRQIEEPTKVFVQTVGRQIAGAGLPVVSGGARGTDRLAMDAAVTAGGMVIGVLADSLERTVRQPDVRQLLLDGRLVLLTPYGPAAGFSVGLAMGRNKVIYGLADFAVVASSDFEKGGTWAGAIEALKAGWCPVFVRSAETAPRGNAELIKLGAVGLPDTALAGLADLPAWLRDHAAAKPQEPDLFAPVKKPTGNARA